MRLFRKKSTPKTIIVDRTSALTNNQLKVTSVWRPRHSDHDATKCIADSVVISTDPLDRALNQYLENHAATPSMIQSLRQLDFDQNYHISGNVWHHGSDYSLALKGMPEHILDFCDLSDNERESIMMQLQSMSATGNYIVALAGGTIKRPVNSVEQLATQSKLNFIGLVGLGITIPNSTKQLIAKIKKSGIAVHLTTGQHPAAGYYIGRQLGVVNTQADVIDGRQLDSLSDEQATRVIEASGFIARADSERKKRIHQLLLASDPKLVAVDTLQELRDIAGKT